LWKNLCKKELGLDNLLDIGVKTWKEAFQKKKKMRDSLMARVSTKLQKEKKINDAGKD
jgi:hypothetical protein